LLKTDDTFVAVAFDAYKALKERKRKDAVLLKSMVEKNETRETPLDLSQLAARIEKHAADDLAWWVKDAQRAERALAVCSLAAGLPSTSAAERQVEETKLRNLSGTLVYQRFIVLNARTRKALAGVGRLAEVSLTSLRETIDYDALVRAMTAFCDDIYPAFDSTMEDVYSNDGLPLDTTARVVLEGVVGRLAEFASTLERNLAGLRDGPAAEVLPADDLDLIIEGAWLTANEVTLFLARQPNASSGAVAQTSMPVATGADAPDAETDAAGERPAGARRKKRRGSASSSRQRAGAVLPHQALVPAQTQTQAAPVLARVVTRSAMGTQVLSAVAEPAAAAAGAARPAAEALPQRLARLEALANFDLPGQQREVSRARRELAPNSAQHVTEETVLRLNQQAAEMAACLEEWDDRGARKQLSSAQVSHVHEQIGRLRVLLADVKGEAKAYQDGMARATLDHMKVYAFPTQEHVQQLLDAGELAAAELPRPLKGEPGTLFEVKLQPAVLRNGVLPRPIWLHVHTAQPVHADKLAKLSDESFAASHVKSDDRRGHNRQWQDAQARAGYDNVLIHRGKITPKLCRTLLSP
jgi:hypothetical protein